MHSASYRRARKILDAHPGTVAVAQAWGVVHSLLVLALLAWAGLVLYLVFSQGITTITAKRVPEPTFDVYGLPEWISTRLPPNFHAETNITDTGLYPVVYRNQASDNPVHRTAARGLSTLLYRLPALQYNLSALMILLAIGLALTLALSLVDQARYAHLSEAASVVASGLRRQIHRQVYRLGHSALPTEGIGPVINLFTREVNDIREGVFTDLDHYPRTPVLLVGLLVVAFFLSWQLSFFLISLGLLVWVTARNLNRGARLASEAASRDAAVQLCLLHEDLGLLRTVRVYGMEAVDSRRFDEHLERFSRSEVRRMKTERSISPTTMLLVGAAVVMAAGLLGHSVLIERISPATAVLLSAALWGLIRPTNDILASRRILRQANRSAGGVFEFLERKPELHQAGGAQFLPPMHQRINFDNVTLQSISGRILLDGVDAEIKAHTRTAILSLDEDAKHALVCMIPRLIDPKHGRVLIDGIDLRDVTLESLRAQVATVFQADLVFSDSVVANIGLGDPSYTLPRIIEAAKMAHAHHFIQDLPHGYDTIIGPLGHYLRPDEQYRIALARAYLHDPSIVIIEEPSMTLDDATKHLIDDSMARLSPGRTLIFLPHRLSTIRSCEHVIVLHEGRVESAGPPRELHGLSKLFRHLQYIEFNQFATGDIEAGQMNE